jgi:hypothetical protein
VRKFAQLQHPIPPKYPPRCRGMAGDMRKPMPLMAPVEDAVRSVRVPSHNNEPCPSSPVDGVFCDLTLSEAFSNKKRAAHAHGLPHQIPSRLPFIIQTRGGDSRLILPLPLDFKWAKCCFEVGNSQTAWVRIAGRNDPPRPGRGVLLGQKCDSKNGATRDDTCNGLIFIGPQPALRRPERQFTGRCLMR